MSDVADTPPPVVADSASTEPEPNPWFSIALVFGGLLAMLLVWQKVKRK